MLAAILVLLAGTRVCEASYAVVASNGNLAKGAHMHSLLRKDDFAPEDGSRVQPTHAHAPTGTSGILRTKDAAPESQSTAELSAQVVDRSPSEKKGTPQSGFLETRPAFLGSFMIGVICMWAFAGLCRAFIVPKLSSAPATTTSIDFWFEMQPSYGDLPLCLSAWCSGLVVIDLALTLPEANVLTLPEFRPTAFKHVSACRLLCLTACVACTVLGPFARRFHFANFANKCSWLIVGITWFFLTQALVKERKFHSIFVPVWTVIGCSLVMVFEGWMRPGMGFSFLQKFVLMNLACSYCNSGILKFMKHGLSWDITHILESNAPRGFLGWIGVWLVDSGPYGFKMGHVMGAAATLFELVLPPIAVFVPAFRPLWYLACLGFHLTIYLIMGPNFVQQAWCFFILIGLPQLMAWSDAQLSKNSVHSGINLEPWIGEYVMQAVGYVVVVMWIYALFDDEYAGTHLLTTDMDLFS